MNVCRPAVGVSEGRGCGTVRGLQRAAKPQSHYARLRLAKIIYSSIINDHRRSNLTKFSHDKDLCVVYLIKNSTLLLTVHDTGIKRNLPEVHNQSLKVKT